MLPEQVDEMLKGYRTAKGRTAHLEVELGRLQAELQRTVDADREEAADLTGQGFSSMPHGSDVGQPTEAKGLRLCNLPPSPEAVAIKKRIHEITITMDKFRITVQFVEAWLLGLTEKERWLIENQTIDCVSWKEVTYHYGVAFGRHATLDTLKRMKRTAMEKIYEMAQ